MPPPLVFVVCLKKQLWTLSLTDSTASGTQTHMHEGTLTDAHMFPLNTLHGNHHGNKMYRTQSGKGIFKFQSTGNNNGDYTKEGRNSRND